MEQATGQRASKRFSPAVEKRAKKDVTGGVTHGKDFLSSLLTSTLIEMCFLGFFCHLCFPDISTEAMWPFLICGSFTNVPKGQEVIVNVV